MYSGCSKNALRRKRSIRFFKQFKTIEKYVTDVSINTSIRREKEELFGIETGLNRYLDQMQEYNKVVNRLERRMVKHEDTLKTLLDTAKTGNHQNFKQTIKNVHNYSNIISVEGSQQELKTVDMSSDDYPMQPYYKFARHTPTSRHYLTKVNIDGMSNDPRTGLNTTKASNNLRKSNPRPKSCARMQRPLGSESKLHLSGKKKHKSESVDSSSVVRKLKSRIQSAYPGKLKDSSHASSKKLKYLQVEGTTPTEVYERYDQRQSLQSLLGNFNFQTH